MAQPAPEAPETAADPSAEGETSEPHVAKPPTRLVLVRHGVTAHTGPLLSGRMPGIDLSDKGIAQAQAAADRLSALTISTVYASPIERTTQTAGYIAARLGLEGQPLP